MYPYLFYCVNENGMRKKITLRKKKIGKLKRNVAEKIVYEMQWKKQKVENGRNFTR